MRLDKEDYERLVSCIDNELKAAFGKEIIKTEEVDKFECRGYFLLKYQYLPKNYRIEIEDEMNRFGIRFIDSDGASNGVSYKEYDGSLSEANIKTAIKVLKEILEGNKYNLFFEKDDKLYKKTPNNEIRRVKDIGELLNG